ALVQHVQRHVNSGHIEVRVHSGGAVTGEVLHASGETSALEAADGGDGVPADHLGACSEAAGADDRVVVGAVDVAAGGEVKSEAEGAQVGAHGRVNQFGQVRVVDR